MHPSTILCTNDDRRDVIRSTIYSGSTDCSDVAIKHLQETPPFNLTTVSDGAAVRGRFGVVLLVVTPTRPSLDRWLAHSQILDSVLPSLG
jgi:hypothetical protein